MKCEKCETEFDEAGQCPNCATGEEENIEETVVEEEPIAKEEISATEEKAITNEENSDSNKKGLIIIIGSCVIILLVCFFAYAYFTESFFFAAKDDKESKVDTKPFIAKEDYPKWDASTATQPLALAFYKSFTGEKNAKLSDFELTKTHEAYVKLLAGDVDFIIVTSPSEDELNLAKTKGVELVVTPVVKEAFVFFAAANNPVNNLTQEQVRGIYTGKIKNWKELGGSDVAIDAYQRPVNSGSQTGILDLVMNGEKMMTPISEAYQIETMSAIISAVSSFNGENAGIGYSYYYYVTTMYEEIDKDIVSGVKLLAIDGVKPKPKTITSGEYPYTTAYYIVTIKGKVSENTQKVIDRMLSDSGQKIATDAQYVPLR